MVAMARLFRLVKLGDRFDTQVFTFQLAPNLTRDLTPDLLSRDFLYGHQRWSVRVARHDHHVGVYLTLKNVSEGLECTLDFTFTLLNREHFTKNESSVERACVFSASRDTHGCETFVGLADLTGRNFAQDTGDFLLELEMRNVQSTFETEVLLPKDPSNSPLYQKLETNYFTFGNFDWNLSAYPAGDGPEQEGRPLVCLTRQTNFDHMCRVRYRLTLGKGEQVLETDALEQVFDMSGQGLPYEVGYNLYNLTTNKTKLHIKVELLSVTAVSEVHVYPMAKTKNRANLYDLDKQAWVLETDITGHYLKLRLYYVDIRNIPRNFLRYMCWGCSILPARSQRMRAIRATGSPHSNYYSQNDQEEGFEMTTEITVQELQEADNVHLSTEDSRLTVHVEWIDSHLLFHEKYQRLDEVSSRHRHQMMREIMALQAENYALEKQLHSYQISISKATDGSSCKNSPTTSRAIANHVRH